MTYTFQAYSKKIEDLTPDDVKLSNYSKSIYPNLYSIGVTVGLSSIDDRKFHRFKLNLSKLFELSLSEFDVHLIMNSIPEDPYKNYWVKFHFEIKDTEPIVVELPICEFDQASIQGYILVDDNQKLILASHTPVIRKIEFKLEIDTGAENNKMEQFMISSEIDPEKAINWRGKAYGPGEMSEDLISILNNLSKESSLIRIIDPYLSSEIANYLFEVPLSCKVEIITVKRDNKHEAPQQIKNQFGKLKQHDIKIIQLVKPGNSVDITKVRRDTSMKMEIHDRNIFNKDKCYQIGTSFGAIQDKMSQLSILEDCKVLMDFFDTIASGAIYKPQNMTGAIFYEHSRSFTNKIDD